MDGIAEVWAGLRAPARGDAVPGARNCRELLPVQSQKGANGANTKPLSPPALQSLSSASHWLRGQGSLGNSGHRGQPPRTQSKHRRVDSVSGGVNGEYLT